MITDWALDLLFEVKNAASEKIYDFFFWIMSSHLKHYKCRLEIDAIFVF